MKKIFYYLKDKLFMKTYEFQGLVQFDGNNKCVICGCEVKWLDTISIKDYSGKKACKKAHKWFKNKYPNYEIIQLI